MDIRTTRHKINRANMAPNEEPPHIMNPPLGCESEVDAGLYPSTRGGFALTKTRNLKVRNPTGKRRGSGPPLGQPQGEGCGVRGRGADSQ